MFFQGRVENNKDPLKLGRCQVRIISLHTSNRRESDKNEYLPVEDLPWAEAAFPITSPTQSGVCDFNVPVQGSHVWLFFKDKEQQWPVYFAVAARIPKERPDYQEGFSDPDKVYPKEESLNESPISRLARNEKINETIVQKKKDERQSWVVNNIGREEYETPYNATYPENRVIETRSGHVIELDDTPGAERINIYHKSGTFKEIHPDGTEVNKIFQHKLTIIIGNHDIKVEANKFLSVAGNHNQQVGIDSIESVGRDKYQLVGRHGGVSCSGNYNVTVTGNATIKANRIDLNP